MIGKLFESTSSSRSTARRRRVVAVAVVALLIGSCVTTVATAGDTLTDIDADTALTERETWEQYEEQGNVSVDVAAPDMTISVAKEHDALDVDGFHNDWSNEYLRVRYGEDIERTIRFYVPSNYFGPYYDSSVESIAGDDVSAKLVPVDDGRYTAVTITFTGKTDATFAISQVDGKTWDFWSKQDQRLENVSGVSTGIAGTDQWNYASDAEWSNGTLTIENVSNPDRVLIQYDGDVSESGEVWLKVPDDQGEQAPAYYFVRENQSAGENATATVVVVSEQESPPAIRVKKRSTARDGIGSVINDWKEIPDRAGSFFDGLFGGGSDEDDSKNN